MRPDPRAALLVALLGCDGAVDDTNPDADGPVTTVDHGVVPSEDGWATLNVTIEPGDTSFLVNAFGPDVLSIDHVIDPDGNIALDWNDWVGTESLTSAFFPCDDDGCNRDVALNWPVRTVDGPLVPGIWSVVVATTNADFDWIDDSPVTATTVIKRDADLATSIVPVRIVYASGVSAQPGVAAGIEGSVEVWREIWGRYGLTLQETYDEVDITANIDFPSSDNDAIAAATADSAPGQLTMIIGEEIGNDAFWLGYSGGIPGALVPGPRSGVIVGWLSCAGPDGEFSTSDMRIAGETMAHEVGHFQGMFHPNETDFEAWDALEDTDKCRTRAACEAANGNNLMYPITVTGIGPQEDLTPEQLGVMMQYVGSP